ncbi:MAG TPA: CAP domain-containing protein [Patescibacteria group bacterium]|jgi:hypothetical protein|nr:CAP domain-containing protein [Patescibacteria group bacterium]
MSTKSLVTLLILVGLVIGITQGLPQKAWHWFESTEIGSELLSFSSGDEAELPAPLRGLIDPSANSHLTDVGVVTATNDQRQQNGRSILHSNAKLKAAAEAKIDDMFAKQYFEHKSPSGKSPADLVREQDYEYIVVGENLALGNFKDDVALVDAWMNSPGHRANILNPKYQEIGVAVRKGQFEGKEVWLAVQEFGAPLSTCPSPSDALKNTIDANRTSIASMQSELQKQKAELDANRYSSRDEYNKAVERYNALANQLNTFSEQTKSLVSEFNAAAADFNKCLESNS